MLQRSLTKEIKTAATRYGRFAYYAGDRYLGRSLEVYGEYSEGEIELWKHLIKPGWRVVDGGANFGYFTLALADLVGPKGTVWAFEPQVECFALLARNTRKHKQVKRINAPLFDRVGLELTLPMLAEMQSGNCGGGSLGLGSQPTVTTTLDASIKDPVDFIKLDVEGAEIAALEGAKRLLRERPLLYLEHHPGNTLPVTDHARRLGYITYAHEVPMFRTDNRRGNPDNVFDIDDWWTVSNNVLCIPEERFADYAPLLDKLIPRYLLDNKRDDLQLRLPKSPRAAIGKTGWGGVARLGGVGDNLIAASVCRPLKAMGLKVEMITQYPMSVVFENNPHIDKISNFATDDLPKDQIEWQKFFVTMGKNYEKFGHLSHTCEATHAFFPGMTQFWWPAHMRRQIAAGSYIETVHAVMDVPLTLGPLFFPTAAEHQQAQLTVDKIKTGGRRGPVIGWCMSGTRVDKIYPPTPFVISRLLRELDANVVMLAAPPPYRDFELCKQTEEMVKAHNGDSRGLFHAGSPSLEHETWPIRRILTMAQHCDLMIGPDTGPMWGVAFEPLPKIMLHSHASIDNIVKHWVNTVSLHADQLRVPCWPCHRLHNDLSTCVPNKLNNGAACISDISPESIVKTVKQLLNQGD